MTTDYCDPDRTLTGSEDCPSDITGVISKFIWLKFRNSLENISYSTQIFKKNVSDKISALKKVLFLSQARAHHSLIFNLQFLYELKHKADLSKTVCGIFHFWFLLLFIKVYFFAQQNDYLTLRRHNSFQNKNKRKATHSFASRPLMFMLQQETWKFNNIYVSWSSLKTGQETNFLNLQNQILSNWIFLNCNF